MACFISVIFLVLPILLSSAQILRKENISLIQNSNEERIVDDIEEAQKNSAFVLVDLEGTGA